MFRSLIPMKITRMTLATSLLATLLLPASAQTLKPFASASGDAPAPPWRVVGLPNPSKNLTRFDIVTLDDVRVLHISSDNAYANLVHELPALAVGPGSTLHWRWRLDQPLPLADLSRKSGDDVPVKVCALFDMPLTHLGMFERNMLRLARSINHDYLPAATLCYIWDHKLPAGTELPNAFTHRVHYIVLDSGTAHLKQWVTHERNLATDFLRVFGHESDGLVPPLMGVLVGADSDNTDGSSRAYASDLVLTLAP